jgi:hypothetical protein
MRPTFYVVSFWVIFVVFACTEPKAPGSETVIARVGNQALTLEQARASIPREAFIMDSAYALSSFRDSWIREQLWYQDAERAGFARDQAIAFRAKQAQVQMVNHLYRRNFMESGVEPEVTDAEIRAYYEKNRKDFPAKEAQLRILHFKSADLKSAIEAKTRLAKKEPYESVVDDLGADKEATLAASRQFVSQSRVLSDIPIMRQYLTEMMATGEISPVRRIGDAFHFIQVLETRRSGDLSPGDDAYIQIKEWLLVEKRRLKILEKEQNLLVQAKASGQLKTYLLPEKPSD